MTIFLGENWGNRKSNILSGNFEGIDSEGKVRRLGILKVSGSGYKRE
jgi:hypothetical protein